MKCPIDGSDLVMTDRSGVEIDYCPTCRGVWLDRGELDKIVERSARDTAAVPRQQAAAHATANHYDRPRKKKKLGGFLDELFDF